jgi:hypothetical protein
MNMGLPQARIVKQGGQLFAPPPPVSTRRPGQLKEQMHDGLALALGMWPLFVAMLAILGLFILATYQSAP